MKQQLNPGNTAPDFYLQSVNGDWVSLDDFKGQQVILVFNRCIYCPFSMLSVADFSNQVELLAESSASVIMVFPTPVEQLRNEIPAELIKENLYFLSDPEMKYYREYGIQSSFIGEIRTLMRVKTLWRAFKHMSFDFVKMRGRLTQLPASFLIDEFQLIDEVKMGKSFGDLISFDRIQKWLEESLKLDIGVFLEFFPQKKSWNGTNDTLLVSHFEK